MNAIAPTLIVTVALYGRCGRGEISFAPFAGRFQAECQTTSSKSGYRGTLRPRTQKLVLAALGFLPR